MPYTEEHNVRNWASILDEPTRLQAERTARLPILGGPLALMADAHLGIGATIGTVIPTESAVVPSAVGVDIGCGMAARKLGITASALPDDLDAWVAGCGATIPAGLGKWDAEASEDALLWISRNPPPETLKDRDRAARQLGTLGGGNHFIEVAIDQDENVWLLLHSGSRGGGNKLASLHTKVAKRLHEGLGTRLEDPELAWLQEGSPEFDTYIRDLRWAQAYAFENRRQLLHRAHAALANVAGAAPIARDINCHHNYTEREFVRDPNVQPDDPARGRWLWVTRKGAIRAGVDDLGLIPGAMGQRSFVIRGRGNPASYESCSHGAGRAMSRTRARKELATEDFQARMRGVSWQGRDAEALKDEAPQAYKDLDTVMRDQADLVEILYELRAVANYKGVEPPRRGRRAAR